jgi:hypothetical protein
MAGAEPPQNTGPFVSVATFCEKVIQEPGGVPTIVRITDTLNQAAIGPDAPREMQPFMANITLMVSLKSGQARGQFGLLIRPEAPGGFQLPPFENSVHLQGEAWGAATIIPMQLAINEPGIYWFDVLLTTPGTDSEQLLTRVPLEVVYQRAAAG